MLLFVPTNQVFDQEIDHSDQQSYTKYGANIC
jgi:hypothetical protein